MNYDNLLAILSEIGLRVLFLKDELTEQSTNYLIANGYVVVHNVAYLKLTPRAEKIYYQTLQEFRRIVHETATA